MAGGHKSPQQQGALGCAQPLSKPNTVGRGALGLHILAWVRFGQRSRFHPVYPARQQGKHGSCHFLGLALPSAVGKSALSQGYREGSRKPAVGGSGCRQPFPPAELISVALLADVLERPPEMGDVGCGMWAGSGCGSAQAPGKRQLVPAGSRGGSEDGSGCSPPALGMGLLWLPSGWELELVQLCECRVSSWLGASSLSLGWPRHQRPLHAEHWGPQGWRSRGGYRGDASLPSAPAGAGLSPPPPAVEGCGPQGALDSMRAPISPSHL